MNRRQFLKNTSTTALMIGGHENLELGKCIAEFLKTDADVHPLILSLKLPTATPLNKMKKFYNEVLQLPMAAIVSELSEMNAVCCS